MTAAGRTAIALVAALLLGGMGTTPPAPPLPGACDLLQSLPADDLVGQSLHYQTTQDRAGDDVRMSMCQGLDADDLPAVTLLFRQDTSRNTSQPALAQRTALIADLTDTFGHAPEVTMPEIGDAALWVAEIGQLTVWSDDARAMFIVTAGDDPELARRLAIAIVALLP